MTRTAPPHDRPTSRLISGSVLAASVALVAAIAVWLGPDGNGDLRNYHYYGGWALFNKPVGFDIAPGQLQTYHHPLLDAVFYRVLRWLNAYPRVFTALWAVPQGVAIWMVFRIALLVFGFLGAGRTTLAIAACAIGGTGAASLPVVGMSMSEALPTVALLGAIWLVIAADERARAGLPLGWRYGGAGLLAGTAAVLKLTTVSALLGIGGAIVAMMLLEPGLPRLRGVVLFGAGVLLALAVLGLPWWLAVYRAFGNPLFPYYNSLFHSPFYPDVNFFDRRFLPQTWQEWLLYPVKWAFRRSNRVTEPVIRDPRMLFELLGCLALLGWALALRIRDRAARLAAAGGLIWVALFAFAAYVLWLRTFSILRYASAIDMLSGIVTLGALGIAVGHVGAGRAWAGMALAVLLIGVTRLPSWERQLRYGNRLIDVQIPRVPPDSTIFLVGVFEGAFLAPFEPASVRFIGLNNNLMQATSQIGLERLVERAVAEATGPLWTISDQGPPLPPPAEDSLRRFGLRSTPDCRPITASIAPPMTLCRVERIGRV